MKAVIIGAGRIGCGFAGQLLHASGFKVVFVARQPIMVDYFNRVGAYRVCLANGPETKEIIVDGVRAVSATEPDKVAKEISQANLIVTAAGVSNLSEVAPLIAAGLQSRTGALRHGVGDTTGSAPVNILAFENLSDAGPLLRNLVANHLPVDFPLAKHGFSGTLVERAVTQQLGDPTEDELLTFVGDPPATFVVDGPSLCQPLPTIAGMIVANNYIAWIERKLYIFSAGHATCAYLGYLKGYRYIHTAIRDPEIRAAVLAAMSEGQHGLAARYGQEIAGDENYLQEIISRFENAALNDPITRVGRNPRRKLGANDRLVGAGRLAEKAGVIPEKLALAAAAALYFHNPADPSASDIQDEIEVTGIGKTLHHICGLDSRRGLGRFVADGWTRLSEGWQRGNLLLKLDQMMWACRREIRGRQLDGLGRIIPRGQTHRPAIVQREVKQ
jgi:mannitol-1-phosphate 5-dehydrogenase